MRRILAVLAIPALASVALAGCGSSKPTAVASTNANATVTATGSFGKAPNVTIPKAKAGSSLTVKTLINGSGPALGKSQQFLGNYVVYSWDGTSHKLAGSTYTSAPTLFTSPLLPGLQTALSGKPIGSRVLAVIPPKEGFGTSGNPNAGITGTTTLVFVIDVLKAFSGKETASGTQQSNGGGSLPTVTEPTKAGTAPTVKIPPSSVKPPTTLQVKTLLKGSGPTVAKGDAVVVQYVGYIWRTGKVFDSSWSRNADFGFTDGATPSQVIPGWDTGLVGQTVGSRVLLVIPPKDGYGSSGASQAGITGTDTLVFVVDIIDTETPSA
ncbi:MAG: FKBP-type peptidyl-prolyl cis-trans isomerase [Streptosporangiaceae bacterium]|nr:FKBP-type peptidyl-prolyl cis-trans isomerase [Streptosporangiaceae bacterium]